ncbi:MAG: hypothetical protein RLZ10_2835, partial [Bacteroidota bacterium]
KLEHVGNAINQISKVFNDGYNELTKGSKVIRYQTPTSKVPLGGTPTTTAVGYEYCRLFTKDRPYYTFSELQKKDGNWRFRQSSYSVLDNTYNLNIAPMKSIGSTNTSTNIFRDGRVKKYMLSIENLAWRTSNRLGYRVEDLPACEIGPNGGRIMWFPPYDISFDDTNRAQWESHNFLGRTEPIYTYKNSERTGSLSFKIVVDHPSVLNTLIKKEINSLPTVTNEEVTKIVDSFFAGCLKYDPYDLLKRFKDGVFSLSDIFEIQNELNNITLDQYEKLSTQIPKGEPTNFVTTDINSNNKDTAVSEPIITPEEEESFGEILLFFDHDIPSNTNKDYSVIWEEYSQKLNGATYLNNWSSNNILSYVGNTILPNTTASFSLGDYIDTRISSGSQTISFFESEYDVYKNFKSSILKLLKEGYSVGFSVDGFASPVGKSTSNNSLSDRRVETIENDILNFEEGGDKISTYKNKLTISGSGFGASGIVLEPEYKDIDCGKRFKGGVDSIYSVQALFCRRAKISKFSKTAPPVETKKEEEKKGSEGAYNPSAGEENAQIPPDQQKPSFNVVGVDTDVPISKLKKKVTKKLLRKLFSECDYFEMIKETDPMIYDGIKQKIKHFQPTFHSITPEGLNSRLTFLNQCVMPGDTIPTAVQKGSTTTLAYNDVYNSAFGAPPICILRVGDFYHSKVLFDNISFKYVDSLLDINPEGIGVQPMIAEVTIGLKFIGGHGLAEPVNRLNNALSFNFYANTEIYDERATETDEYIKADLESEILNTIKEDLGLIEPGKDPDTNDNGNPIGTVENTYVDPAINNIVGIINYKKKMNELIDLTSTMVNNVKFNLFEVANTLNIGGLIYFTYKPNYSNAYIDFLNGTTNEFQVFGKQETLTERLEKLYSDTEKDIDDDLCPLFSGYKDNQDRLNLKNSDYRKIKRELKNILTENKTQWNSVLSERSTNIVNKTLNFIQIIDQMNFILTNKDGYLNSNNKYIMYNISGTTEIAPTTSSGTTYDELKNDTIKIGSDLSEFFNRLKLSQIIPDGEGKEYNDDYTFDVLFENESSKAEKRFFIIFSNT